MPNAELDIIEPTEPEADSGSGSMPTEIILAPENHGAEKERKKYKAQSDPDIELVKLARQGDRKAFDQLVARHQPHARAVALRIIGNSEDVKDVVQEAFMSAYLSIGGFEGESKFSSWLYRIVVNQCLMLLRERKREPEDVTNDLESEWRVTQESLMPRFNTDPLQELERRELTEHLRLALEALKPHFRGAIIMKDVEGMSCRDIAEAMGRSESENVIRKHRYHARKKLRLLLSKYIEDDTVLKQRQSNLDY